MMQTTEVFPSSMSFNHDPISTNHNPNNHPPLPPLKKKRNLPGNPDPEADVISLSPRTLMATNRFVCDICNKGFQRDQNLQLHRRGHNLPWKLKQRSTKEVKKVYVCPEKTCVHHDPSRALGDLTGIKKHFSRKHGEKRWKCEKCSKKYAVKSDWKAHSKTCGTREYRCDCGTIFFRRDSFITHRAFCDALTEESARLAPPIVTADSAVGGDDQSVLANILMQKYRDEDRYLKEADFSLWLATNSGYFNQIMNVPATTTGVDLFAVGSGSIGKLPEMFHIKEKMVSSMYNSSGKSNRLVSTTALLQKAAQIGSAAVSSPSSSAFVGLNRPLVPILTPQQHKNIERIPNSYNHDSVTNNVLPMRIPVNAGEIPNFPIPLKLNDNGMGESLTRDFLGLGGEESSCRPMSTQDLARLSSIGNAMDLIGNGTYKVMWSGDLA